MGGGMQGASPSLQSTLSEHLSYLHPDLSGAAWREVRMALSWEVTGRGSARQNMRNAGQATSLGTPCAVLSPQRQCTPGSIWGNSLG